MSEVVTSEVELIAQSPFEVILIQTKVGVIFGILTMLPILYIILRREVLGYDKLDFSRVPTSVLATGVITGLILFIAGLIYSYEIFFPFVFSFLAEITIETSIAPTYSITEWTQFIIILSLSFGLVSQIPVFIPILVKYEVISYRFVRSKWRHWVFGVFFLGAIFSPPEPVSQFLWATPLVLLYIISLGVSRIVASKEQIVEYNNSTKSDKNKKEYRNKNDESNSDIKSRQEKQGLSQPIQDEIGGYYYKIRPYLKSMQDNIKMAMIIFAVTMFLSFFTLFTGGLRWAFDRFRTTFESPENLNIIALHPVEILSFQVKLAAIIALIITIPIWIYVSIPEYQKKNLWSVSQGEFIQITTFFTILLAGGTILGYLYIVPEIFEFLVDDAVNRDMIISYRINSFFWLVIYLSASFGLLLSAYFSVLLGYKYGIHYNKIVRSWRKIVFAIFMAAVLITPTDAGTSILFSLPIVLTYICGAATISIFNKTKNLIS